MEVKPSYSDTIRADIKPSYKNFLTHHGIQGQRWGIRRFEDEDGHLTDAGQKRYAHFNTKEYTESLKNKKKSSDKKADETKQQPNNASNMRSSGSSSGSGIRIGSMKILQDENGNYYAQLGDQIVTGSNPNEVAYNYGAAMRENSRAKVAANNAEDVEEDEKDSGSNDGSGDTDEPIEETPSYEVEQTPIEEETVPVSNEDVESEAQPISGEIYSYSQPAIENLNSGLALYEVKSSDVEILENILDNVGTKTISGKTNRSINDVFDLILGESQSIEEASDDIEEVSNASYDTDNILGKIGRVVRKKDGVAKKHNQLNKETTQDKIHGKTIKINKVNKIQKKSNYVKHSFEPIDTIPSFKDQLDIDYISHYGIKRPCLW